VGDPHPTPTAQAPHAKLRATTLTRTFGRPPRAVDALGPVDLTVAPGEFVCLVGPSGCGKSTLLRIAAGLLRPSTGALEIRTSSSRPAAMIFQDHGIYAWKTVRANVASAWTSNASRAARPTPGPTTGWPAWPVGLRGRLPGRPLRRHAPAVAIARALAVEPELLLMDEPFAALDAQLRMILQDELLDLTQALRTTTLFITHSLEEAIVLGDRVLVMSARPGRVIALLTDDVDAGVALMRAYIRTLNTYFASDYKQDASFVTYLAELLKAEEPILRSTPSLVMDEGAVGHLP
jgi:NitT/TauT family transport system ATP-binding protein